MNDEDKQKYSLGMVGLGVMGRNLLLNMADKGFSVAGYDSDLSKVAALKQEGKSHPILGAENIENFVESLKLPRVIMMLVPAGAPVDAVTKELLPLLEKGDLLIDAGNSYFKDTDRRIEETKKIGVNFMGVGLSGGEEGARHGPSIMPGGTKQMYSQVAHIFQAIAAHVNDDPCVAYLGAGSAGHFVKMVHNGIEYAIMQLIAETYHIMKGALGLSNEELHEIYNEWNQGESSSYLLEITAQIFRKKEGSEYLIDEILDVAKQKGTGRWTCQTAMELQVPTPTIDIAVSMRNLSMQEELRQKLSKIFTKEPKKGNIDKTSFIASLHQALYAAMMLSYAQGMALLSYASTKLNYGFDIGEVARIWRGGCIIRAKMLEDIRKAYQKEPTLANLLLDEKISQILIPKEKDLRHIICEATDRSIPIPAFTTALNYLDSYSSSWSPANLIQAQRDFFGSHTFEKIDTKGAFHAEWEKE